MSIRRKFAAFALAATTLTAGLGTTLMAGTASAHGYYGEYYIVEDTRIDQVGSEFWSGSKFNMETHASRYVVHGTLQIKTSVWTTSWVGFTGCLTVQYLDASGRYLGSTSQRVGTTGFYGERRTVYWVVPLDPEVNQKVWHFNIIHSHCAKA